MFNKLKILSKMKKIKLFALAAFAMLSTNVFAQEISATKVFTFEAADKDADECTITGFVADLDDEFKTATAIPETVTHPSYKVGGKAKKYFVKKIAKGAFANEPIETITFPAAVAEDEYTGISDIGAGAFEGTKIQKLDLSNTIIKQIKNFFGTKIAAAPKDDKVNATLTSVIFPATITSVKDDAFWGCTKLASVNMTAATKLASIGAGAFAGCPLTSLDLSKNTKVVALAPKTLYDGVRYWTSSALVTVTLHQDFNDLANNLTGAAKLTTVTGHIYTSPSKKDFTALLVLNPDEFKGCAALTTFETKYITTFDDGCFDGCAALATADISSATTIGKRAFAGTALTSVTFPAANTGLTTIDDQAFFECASLETATLAVKDKKTTIKKVGDQAFAYTGITSFTVPEPTTNTKFVFGAKAFAGTPITSFTWNATAYDGLATGQLIADDAFSKCSGVTFYTTAAFITGWQTVGGDHAAGKALANGPTNSKFSTATVDPNIKFTTTAYSTNPNKFYVKWYSNGAKKTNIQVKRSECKVYAGYLEGDGSLAMIQYKADDKGIITIVADDAALIITDKSDLTYVAGGTATTSWMGTISALYTADQTLTPGQNALKYCTGATTRGTLENQLTDDSFYIYGWMKAGGFQKIATGTNIPAGTLFAFAKEPVDGARMTVKWYDENGNLEGETTAIDAIDAVAPQAEGQRYNVAGQKVSASYKGLVIKDGKKYMQK
jgi:hypothetical protein